MFLQQFPGGLYSVHFQQGQHFSAQTGFIQHWNYLYVQLTKVKFGLISSDIALLSFPPCYFRLKTFRAASISNEFHGWHSLFLAWIPICQSTSVSSTTFVLFLVFIRIHNDGARKWEPCWLLNLIFCVNTFDQAHYFWEYQLAVKRFFLFVCTVWTF